MYLVDDQRLEPRALGGLNGSREKWLRPELCFSGNHFAGFVDKYLNLHLARDVVLFRFSGIFRFGQVYCLAVKNPPISGAVFIG